MTHRRTFFDKDIVPVLMGWYWRGIFPMAEETGEIFLYEPVRRGVIFLDRFHVPDSLRKIVRAGKFEIRINTDFESVIHACADRESTWISAELIRWYTALHRSGYAHSVEAWRENQLAGGLYGVSIGSIFCGESMFHRQRDASKVALVALVEHMKKKEMLLIDTQFTTEHLRRFGAVDIDQEEYLRYLQKAKLYRGSFFP